MSQQQSKPQPPQMPFEMEEDFTLHRMAGGSAGIAAMFSEQNIARAQQVMDDARNEYFSSSLLALHHVREQVNAAPADQGTTDLHEVQRFVKGLSTQADMLAFPFISRVCMHVELACTVAVSANINQRLLVRDMLDIIRIALHNKILDEQSQVAQDVIASLEAVSARLAR